MFFVFSYVTECVWNLLCTGVWQRGISGVHRRSIYTLSCLRGTYRGSEIYVRSVVCNVRRIFHTPNVEDTRDLLRLTHAYREECFFGGPSAAEVLRRARLTAMSMRESRDIRWVYRSRVPKKLCVTKVTVFSSSTISCSIRKADANLSMSLLKFGSIISFLTLNEGNIVSCVMPVTLWIECESV